MDKIDILIRNIGERERERAFIHGLCGYSSPRTPKVEQQMVIFLLCKGAWNTCIAPHAFPSGIPSIHPLHIVS